jgi:hypothetical protein
MDRPPTTPIFERLLASVGQSLNPEAARKLVELQIDRRTQAQVAKLADKCNRGTLTATERAEYESFVSASEVIAVLQAQARRLLKRPTG